MASSSDRIQPASDAACFPLGRIRGLQACSGPTGRFVVLAIDHRQNLRRALRSDDPSAVTPAELVEFKQGVVAALGSVATAVLLDPEYGLAQCISGRVLPGSVGLIVSLEATGYAGEPTARRTLLLPGWSIEAAQRAGADAVKLLVYYHPDAPTAAEQEALVAETVEACRARDVCLFLEPLVYSLDPDRPLPSAARRDAVVETAHRLTKLGPDVLKSELPAAPDDSDAWVEAACRELDDASCVPWTVLSGATPPERFPELVEIACAQGASGVVAGRAVWEEATRLRGPLRNTFLTREARARLDRLHHIVERSGRPWWERHALGRLPDPPTDWYRRHHHQERAD